MLKSWQIPEIWKGGEAWILGGGPSFIDCFNIPNEVVNDVRYHRKGLEAYTPFLAKIAHKHIIGVNVAYQLGNIIDFCLFGDLPFFLSHEERLYNFGKTCITTSPSVAKRKDVEWLKYIPREIKRGPTHEQHLGISSNPSNVRWNFNSGAEAINVAAWMGVKRIVLVGFDMNLSATNNRHFHNEYRTAVFEKTKEHDRRKLPFSKHLRGFPIIKQDAERMGIEIINTSLNSAIKDFPKVHIDELL